MTEKVIVKKKPKWLKEYWDRIKEQELVKVVKQVSINLGTEAFKKFILKW